MCAEEKGTLHFSNELLDQMAAAMASHPLVKVLEALGKLDLLIVDDYCAHPYPRRSLFFQFVSWRYEKGYF